MSLIVYTSKTCPHCTTAKQWLRSNGIDFSERALEDPNHYREYAKLQVQGVPTFVIDDAVIVGLNTAEIMAKLPYTVERCPSCQRRMRLPKGKGSLKVTCPHCRYPFEFESKA